MRMRNHSLIPCFMVLLLVPVGRSAMGQTILLSGRVYEGQTGVEPPPLGDAKALAGVTVTLYGSNNTGQQGTYLTSTTTDSEGWYGLEVQSGFEFYSIVETDPAGYTSVGATTIGGSVIGSNRIQYAYPIDGKTLTGNKFWDEPEWQPAVNQPPVVDAGPDRVIPCPGLPHRLPLQGVVRDDGLPE